MTHLVLEVIVVHIPTELTIRFLTIIWKNVKIRIELIITGMAPRFHISVFGGGMCNTEFEALTGNTLAFLGAGAYLYTENVTKPMFSLAQYFKNPGHVTESFHANEAQSWNRNMVYPNLGQTSSMKLTRRGLKFHKKRAV